MSVIADYWSKVINQLASWSWLNENWAFVAIGLTCLSVLVLTGLILGKYVRIILNLFVDTQPPLSMGPLDFKTCHGEIVRFRSFDGTSLRGMHVRAPNRSGCKGTIVFCHEFSSDMYSCARYGRPLIDAGFDLFTFDFRSHGESSSSGKYKSLQWPSDKEMEDVLGACGYVESVLTASGKPSNIGIFGISRGAGAGLLAAASDTNIKAIVCDGAFSTDTTIISLMKKWAKIFARIRLVYENHPDAFWRFLFWLTMRFAQPRMGCRFLSVSKALKEMKPRPILFIHGESDSYIRVDQTEILYKAAPSPKYMWVVPKAKHNQSVLVDPGQYAQRTVAFFRQHLARENISESQITTPAQEIGVA